MDRGRAGFGSSARQGRSLVDERPAAVVATFAKFAEQLADVGAAGLPAVLQVRHVRLELRRSEPAGSRPYDQLAGRRHRRGQQAPHRPAIDAQLARDRPPTAAGRGERQDLLPASASGGAARGRPLFGGAELRWLGAPPADAGLGRGRAPARRPTRSADAAPEQLVERGAGVLEQVEAVGDLDRVRCSAARAPSAYAPERSRTITSTPGCSRSQAASASAVRSGTRSIGRCVSKSTRIVAYRWPRAAPGHRRRAPAASGPTPRPPAGPGGAACRRWPRHADRRSEPRADLAADCAGQAEQRLGGLGRAPPGAAGAARNPRRTWPAHTRAPGSGSGGPSAAGARRAPPRDVVGSPPVAVVHGSADGPASSGQRPSRRCRRLQHHDRAVELHLLDAERGVRLDRDHGEHLRTGCSGGGQIRASAPHFLRESLLLTPLGRCGIDPPLSRSGVPLVCAGHLRSGLSRAEQAGALLLASR